MSSNSNKTMLVPVTQDNNMTNFQAKTESYNSFKANTISNTPNYTSGEQKDYISVGNPFLSLSSSIFKEIDTLQNSYEIGKIENIRNVLISKIDLYTELISSKEIENSQIMISRYILCTFADELISSTYWGKDNNWANNSLLGYFYNETYGGDKFFQILEQLYRSSSQYIHLLELLYICLSLGFEGKYRIQNKGRMELDSIRENLYRQIKVVHGRDTKPFYTVQKTSQQQNRLIYKTSYQILALSIVLVLSLVYGVLTFSLAEKENSFLSLLNEKYEKYDNFTEIPMEEIKLFPAMSEPTNEPPTSIIIKDLN